MLSELAIKKFAIIEDIRISFQPGLSVLTGETGAGKSIIIQAVNLLLGSRASADLVRTGEETAELEACFDITPDSDPARLLAEQGREVDDTLIIRRLISRSGKGRVFINDRQSTLEFLRRLTADLAGIAGQHAHQGLLREDKHLDILDEFAGTQKMRAAVTALHRKLLPVRDHITELERERDTRRAEQELIQFQVDEIEAAAVAPGEDEALEQEKQVLANAAKIFEAVGGAVHEVYDREGSVIEQLSRIMGAIDRFSRTDEALARVVERVNAVTLDLQDVVDTLRDYASGIDLDPESLERVDERLDLISRLKRKYGGSLDALFAHHASLTGQLAHTRDLDRQIQALTEEKRSLTRQIQEHAMALSRERKAAAGRLSDLAHRELAALEMDKARFKVTISHAPPRQAGVPVTPDGYGIGSGGIDQVCFMLQPNPGEEARPLSKIASGGELSRIVLALKAVLSDTRSFGTLIFDEVDAGIGGATAEKVGLKLAALARRYQVICITHQAQIARHGHHQFRISKQVVDDRTRTDIVPLIRPEERVEELARMIGGTTITDATRTHAKELLARSC